jgi:hypothetical protein
LVALRLSHLLLLLCLTWFISHSRTCPESIDTLMLWVRGWCWGLFIYTSSQRLRVLISKLWSISCIVISITIMFHHFLLLRNQKSLWALIGILCLGCSIIWTGEHVFRFALCDVIIPWFLLTWSLFHSLIEICIALIWIGAHILFVCWHLLVNICLLVPYYSCNSLLCFSNIKILAGFSILVFIYHSIFLLNLCLIWLAWLFPGIKAFSSCVTLWLGYPRRPIFAIFWWKLILNVFV